MIPGLSTVKLIGLAIAAASILSFVLLAFHWKSTMTARGEQLATICAATRSASGQPKLKCSEVPKQIAFMGEAIGTLTTALNKQSAAVTAMGEATKDAQLKAAEASQEAAGRAKRASDTSQGLQASSRAGERLAKPCEPSKDLAGAWK